MINTDKCKCPMCGAVVKVIKEENNDDLYNKYLIACPKIHTHELTDYISIVKSFNVLKTEDDTTDLVEIYTKSLKVPFRIFDVHNNKLNAIK